MRVTIYMCVYVSVRMAVAKKDKKVYGVNVCR